MTFKQLLPATAMTMLLSGAIYAGEEVDRTIGVRSDGVVQIENVRGIIRVEGWDRDEVSVKGTLDDSAERLIFETNGAVTNVIVKMPKGRIKRGDGSNLVIRVPNTNQVDFEGVSSDLFVNNISGGVDLATVSGDIDTNNISKQVFLKSVSGDLVIKESSGQARLSSVSGDIEANLDSQEVEANTVSGDVTLHLTVFTSLYASSVNGEVWIKGAQSDDGETDINSVNGDITLNFTKSLNARIKAKTGPGGDIDNDLTADPVENIFPNQQKLSCNAGNGNGKVKLSTVNGSIKLKGE